MIRVHIERVVLRGMDLPGSSAAALREAVARHLEAALRDEGATGGLRASRSLAVVASPRVRLPLAPNATSTAAALGGCLAAVVAQPSPRGRR